MADTTPYVVRQGDYLEKLAYTLGFDKDAVWNSEDNQELRALRGDGTVLLPGDILRIPPPRNTPPPIEGGGSNAYATDVPKIEVRVMVVGLDDEVLANEPCEIADIPNAPTSTEGDGRLVIAVPVTTRTIEVRFPNRDFVLGLDVGGLDPHAEESGVKHRLANLGLYVEGDADEATALRNAISVFQRQQGLTVTGEVDDATRAKLVAAHRV